MQTKAHSRAHTSTAPACFSLNYSVLMYKVSIVYTKYAVFWLGPWQTCALYRVPSKLNSREI